VTPRPATNVFRDEERDRLVGQAVREAGRAPTVTFLEVEPEPIFCPLISVDDHVLEPPNLFRTRLPRKFADRAPRIELDDVGLPWWHIDGAVIPNLMLNGASGRAIAEWGLCGATYEEFRRGVWDPKHRLADMDLAGVWASLCFPSDVWGFAGTRFATFADTEFGLACLRAYNDWHIEEWCGTAPDRFIPCQLPWLLDPELAAGEIRRNAERGFRAVSFSENPEGRGLPNIYDHWWDPFFRACEETDTVVNLHVGTSGSTRLPCSSTTMAAAVALFPESAIEALVEWIFAGVPLRFPRLQIVLSEGGASWVPMALERLARADRQRGSAMNDWPLDAPSPQELALRNFSFTSIEDPSAFKALDIIGADRVMLETDYPHFDSTWPTSQRMVASELSHLDPTVVRQVCFENAADRYRHPQPPAELVAASYLGELQASGC
jgi:predicted TIM-barrel fold metal-dependent hydrolase